MSDLVKDIVGAYLKEDLQKVLQKTTELKEARLSRNHLQSRISSIAKMNKLADPNKIYAGKTLNIDGSKYTIKRGDNLTKIARSFPGTTKSAPAPKPVASRPAAPDPEASKPSTQYNPRVGSRGMMQDRIQSKINRQVAPGRENQQKSTPPIKGPNLPATTKAPAEPPAAAPQATRSLTKPAAPSQDAPARPAVPTSTFRDQGAVERQRMASEKPSTAPTPDIPKVSSNRIDVEVTGTAADFGGRKYRLPDRMRDTSGGKEAGSDFSRSQIASRGIRSLNAGKVDTSKFNYPGDVGGQKRALEPPTQSNAAPSVSASTQEPKAPEVSKPISSAPETPKVDTSAVSSALTDKIKPSQLASNPENLVNKDVTKGREPKPMNESFVNVGSNKYRIV